MLPVKKSEQQLIVTSTNEKYLSAYVDVPLTKKTAEHQFERIKNAYGDKIPNGFFDELSTILRNNNFTNKKLIDAVNNMVQTEVFPSIAKIAGYDKRIRLFTYHEFLEETKDTSPAWKEAYKAVNVDGNLFYALKAQLRDNNIDLPEWQKEATGGVRNKKSKTDPGTGRFLSKDFSFVAAFNEIVQETGVGDKISEKEEKTNDH